MSQIISEDSFKAVTATWIDDHTYVGRKDQALKVLLVATELFHPNDASRILLQVDCGFGYFQVHGFYDGSNDTFDCVAANLVVPSFGPIPMVSNVVFDLKKSAAVPVDLGGAVKGNIKIEYGADNSQVVVDYDLAVSFVGGGILQDTLPLFPVNPTAANEKFPRKEADIGAIRSNTQAKRLISSSSSGSGGHLVIRDRTEAEQNQVNLLNNFLDEFLKDGSNIIIQTYYPKGSAVPIPDGLATSSAYSATFHFAILKLVASINPSNLFLSAQLFVSVPLAGLIPVADIFGSLVDGQGAKGQFDVSAASGNTTLYAKKGNNNKHDLYVSFSVTTSLHGPISVNDYKLVTLPF